MTASQLLPSSTVAYAEISDPKALLATALDHSLRKRIESLPQVRKGLKSPGYTQFQAVLSVVEKQIDMKWRDALESLTAGGICVAFDAESEGAALLVKARDEKTLE